MSPKRKGKRLTWHKNPELRAKCPKCGKVGSGMYSRWVLNEQKKRYEPYYYFAHPWSRRGGRGVKWCYIRKKRAQEILSSRELRAQYQLGNMGELK